MYYANQETSITTFTADEVGEAIINDSTFENSIKREILHISAIQMGVELEEIYPKHPSYLERFLISVGKELKEEIYIVLFQECQTLLQESLLH